MHASEQHQPSTTVCQPDTQPEDQTRTAGAAHLQQAGCQPYSASSCRTSRHTSGSEGATCALQNYGRDTRSEADGDAAILPHAGSQQPDVKALRDQLKYIAEEEMVEIECAGLWVDLLQRKIKAAGVGGKDVLQTAERKAILTIKQQTMQKSAVARPGRLCMLCRLATSIKNLAAEAI